MILVEADVVFGMPVSAGDDEVEQAAVTEVVNEGEDFKRARDGKAATLAEVMLDIDDYKGGFLVQGTVHL